MLANGAGGGAERFQFIHHVPDPWHDPAQAHATPWVRVEDGSLFRTVYIPAGMGMEEARRFLDGERVVRG